MKGSKRQENFRQRQRAKNLLPLQLRITRYAHSKALELKKQRGGKIGDIYEAAILAAHADTPPEMHEPSFEEEYLGVKSICPWVAPATIDHFELLANQYRSTVTTMSAALYQYCKRELDE